MFVGINLQITVNILRGGKITGDGTFFIPITFCRLNYIKNMSKKMSPLDIFHPHKYAKLVLLITNFTSSLVHVRKYLSKGMGTVKARRSFRCTFPNLTEK